MIDSSTVCCCYKHLTMNCINYNNVHRNVCFGKYVEVLDAKRIIYNIVVSLKQYKLKGAFKVVHMFGFPKNSYYNVFKKLLFYLFSHRSLQ